MAPVLTPSHVDLGEQPRGVGPGPEAELTLRNPNDFPVDGVGVSIAAQSGNTDEFRVRSTCPVTVGPGESCSIFVSLEPTTLGPKVALLEGSGGGSSAVATITGRSGFVLTVMLSGPNQGTVSSDPPGIDCPTACSAVFDVGSSVTLRAAPPDGASASWTAPCTSPGPECTVVMAGDEQRVVSFVPWLVIDVDSYFQAGAVHVEPLGADCSFHCTFPISGPVTLTAVNAPQTGPPDYFPTAAILSGWSGACSGDASRCTLDVSGPTSVRASFQGFNRVFVTGPMRLLDILPDGSGADALCNSAAQSVGWGDSAPYVAWIAATQRNPATLLKGALGWGFIVAPDVATITRGALWGFIGFDPVPVITGAALDGTTLGLSNTCSDWTSANGSAPAGMATGLGYTWSVDPGSSRIACSDSAGIVCFGTGYRTGTPVFPDASQHAHRLTFVSSPWVVAAGQAGADSHCQAEAIAAGLGGTFIAQLSSADLPPGADYIRTDAPTTFAPANIDARGNPIIPVSVSDSYVWVPSDLRNCSNWTGGTGAQGSVERFDVPQIQAVVDCSEAHRLRCFQQ
ncbi:MAG TPA: hypothetical protein VK454_03555 [Myxococcaceae bacterium]|nr:hypothetical protein [Myxococcaceae bacterium]